MNTTISITELSSIIATLDNLLIQVRDTNGESAVMRDRTEAKLVLVAVMERRVDSSIVQAFDYLRRNY